MDILISGTSEVTITGHIKTIEDYQKIKQTINSLIEKGLKELTLRIPDSLSMTSSVIGYLLKLVYENNISLSLFVCDDRLYNLLEVLNLATVFNVKRIS
ncbi:hypothetical protein MCHI_002152 [Candidatus Magnetoovum chiemensis]|nr:hypothetical protein MCHI_002152 [Candidatus Magnetoovum chiemensis]